MFCVCAGALTGFLLVTAGAGVEALFHLASFSVSMAGWRRWPRRSSRWRSGSNAGSIAFDRFHSHAVMDSPLIPHAFVAASPTLWRRRHKRIAAARVCVIGIRRRRFVGGGILARSGIGRLTLIDRPRGRVNINHQVTPSTPRWGRPGNSHGLAHRRQSVQRG